MELINEFGWPFVIFIFFFPRVTMLLSEKIQATGAVWWVFWFCTPRLLVGVLGTVRYWNVNKLLVVVIWIWALGGEVSEKTLIRQRKKRMKKRRR